MYRETDPLGGPVLTWPAGTTSPAWHPDGNREGTLGFATDPLTGETIVHDVKRSRRVPGAVRHGHDARLVDPVTLGRVANRPVEPVRGHGDYDGVVTFDIVVDEVRGLIRCDRSHAHHRRHHQPVVTRTPEGASCPAPPR